MRVVSYILLTLISITSFGQTDVKVKRLYSDSVKVGNQWVSPYQWEKLKTSGIVDSNKFSTHYYTNRQIAAATTGLVDYRGTYNASTGTFPSTGGSGTAGAILKGDYWSISVEGTIGGVLYTVGSSLLAMVDNPGQTAANWDKQITGSTLAVRTFEDINSGVPAYSGTTLKDGQFYGGNLTPTGVIVGGYNGNFGCTTITPFGSSSTAGSIYSYKGSGTGSSSVIGFAGGGYFMASSTINGLDVRSNSGICGNYTTATGKGIVINQNNGNTANSFETYNNNVLKASIDYTGKLTANGADFKTYTSVITSNNITSLEVHQLGTTGRAIYGYGGVGVKSIYAATTGGVCFSASPETSSSLGIEVLCASGAKGMRILVAGDGMPLQIDSSSRTKLIIDNQGDIHNTPPHASSWFADSSRLITLTQNTWTGITNTWEKLYPSTGANYYFNKITKTGDSCKITKAGRYEIIYELNATGTANARYEYRLCKRSGSTITYYNKQVSVGTGVTVVRIVSGSLPLIANDVVWAEVRTTTTGNNSITVIGGQIRIKTIKLDL